MEINSLAYDAQAARERKAMLYDELAIGTLRARNRVVRSATAESLATPGGLPTPRLVELYEELARGGVGTIITGYAAVTPDGKPSEGALGIFDDAGLATYRDLVCRVHALGARVILQLVYGGSKSKLASDDPRWIKATEESLNGSCANVDILGASEIEHPKTRVIPREATSSELANLAKAFGAAAARVKDCGFDGVEVHVAHGYLLSQFLNRRFNVRRDGYGGSLENRARLAVECIRQVRNAVGADYPVLAKVNSCDDIHDPAGLQGGLSEDESERVCELLVRAGADCIDVTGDWHAAKPSPETGEPFFAEFGARIARSLRIPVIVTGGWRRPEVIEQHLQSDGIAAVGLCRPLICEPDLVARWQAGNMAPSRCTACGYCQKHVGIPCALRQ